MVLPLSPVKIEPLFVNPISADGHRAPYPPSLIRSVSPMGENALPFDHDFLSCTRTPSHNRRRRRQLEDRESGLLWRQRGIKGL